LSYEGFGKNFDNNQLPLYYHTSIQNNRDEYLKICKRWDDMFEYKGLTVNQIGESTLIPHIHPDFLGGDQYHCYNFTREIKELIIEKFNLQKKEKTKKNEINVHIRRGDVTNITNNDRWLSDEYYLNTLDYLKQKFPNSEIKIYTQKKNFNKEKFSKYKVYYDDEILDNEVWLNFMNSDILVIGKSSFSYSAGILCDGIVIYPSDGMFHPKLKDWKNIYEL
jgi:hypothetical protein